MRRKSAPECAVEPRRPSRPALPPVVLCEPAHPKLTLPVVWIAWFSDTTKVWPSPVWAHQQQPGEPWRCTLFVQVSASVTIPSAALCPPPERETVSFNSLYAILVAFRWYFFFVVAIKRGDSWDRFAKFSLEVKKSADPFLSFTLISHRPHQPLEHDCHGNVDVHISFSPEHFILRTSCSVWVEGWVFNVHSDLKVSSNVP